MIHNGTEIIYIFTFISVKSIKNNIADLWWWHNPTRPAGPDVTYSHRRLIDDDDDGSQRFPKISSANDFLYSSHLFSTTNFRNDCSAVGSDPSREHTVRPQMFDALCLVRNATGTSRHLTLDVAITTRPGRFSPVTKA